MQINKITNNNYIYELLHIFINIFITNLTYKSVYLKLVFNIEYYSYYNNVLCFCAISLFTFFHSLCFSHNEHYHHFFSLFLIFLGYLYFNTFITSVLLFFLHGFPGIFTYSFYILYKYNLIAKRSHNIYRFIINFFLRTLMLHYFAIIYLIQTKITNTIILGYLIIFFNTGYYTIMSYNAIKKKDV